jgi:hypothetical protein
METFLSNSKFTEYNNTRGGRYFIKAERKDHGQWVTIGYIFRSYNNETKKTTYRATDFGGNQVFVDYKDLSAIKKQFIEHGQTLAQSVPVNVNKEKLQEKIMIVPKAERNNELKNIREKKASKEKTKKISKENSKVKKSPDQKEKEQDVKNTEKYKDAGHSKDGNNSKENMPDKNILSEEGQGKNTSSDKSLEDYVAEGRYEEFVKLEEEAIAESAREFELDQLRKDNDDREQEQEMDIDM